MQHDAALEATMSVNERVELMGAAARDKAEELFLNLQKRAREMLDAEDGVVHSVKTLIEERGVSPHEAKKHLEDLLGRIKAAKVWDRIRNNDAIAVLSDYRDGVERVAEESVAKIVRSMQIATKSDVEALTKQVATLNKKLTAFGKKLDGIKVDGETSV